MAESSDGLHFTRRDAPVLYPDRDAQQQNEWPGGVEDPRLVQTEDGTYVLTYTQWNRDVPRLAIATSRDLMTWTKHGPAFADAAGGKYLRMESKSGAILTRVVGDRLVATKVNGKYWMYFNVPDILDRDVGRSDPLDAARRRGRQAREGALGAAGLLRLVARGGGAAGDPHGARDRAALQRGQQRASSARPGYPRAMYTGGQALFDATQSGEAARALRCAVHPADGAVRAHGPVRRGDDVRGRAGPVQGAMVPLLWNGRLARGRGGGETVSW